MSESTFRSSLEERTGLSARDLSERVNAEIDPLPAVLPPEGVTAGRMRDVATRVPAGAGTMHVSGVHGCAGAALAAAIVAGDAKRKHVVVVTSDLEAARRVADDVAFFVRSTTDEATAEDTAQGDVLVLAANESSPYADVNPDRRAAPGHRVAAWPPPSR